MAFNEKEIETAGVNLLKAERVYQEADVACREAIKEVDVAKDKLCKARDALSSYSDVRDEARAAYAKAFKKVLNPGK